MRTVTKTVSVICTIEDYCLTKKRMLEDYKDKENWGRKMLVNISKAGFFSSDRTIRQYNEDIWKL